MEEADALALVGKLNADPRVSGILILRPLPQQVSEEHLYRQLDPLKDVEAVHPENAGLLALGEPRYTPSTPASIFYLLDRYVEESGRDPATFYNGLDLVLVGRSNNVGKPALWLGLARGATVVSCHRFTAQAGRLEEHTRQADILVVAAGVPGLVTGDMVKEGVIAVDVGHQPGARTRRPARCGWSATSTSRAWPSGPRPSHPCRAASGRSRTSGCCATRPRPLRSKPRAAAARSVRWCRRHAGRRTPRVRSGWR